MPQTIPEKKKIDFFAHNKTQFGIKGSKTLVFLEDLEDKNKKLQDQNKKEKEDIEKLLEEKKKMQNYLAKEETNIGEEWLETKKQQLIELRKDTEKTDIDSKRKQIFKKIHNILNEIFSMCKD